MSPFRRRVAVSAAALAIAAQPVDAQARLDSLTAVRAFVNKFYAWYAPLSDSSGGVNAGRVVLRLHRDQITDSLYAAIKAADDLEAQTGEPIFNADYFLWSQDPCHHYHVTSVQRFRQRFRARVECVESSEYQQGVFAEVIAVGSSWRITNIINADGKHDLIAALIADVEAARRATARARPNEPLLLTALTADRGPQASRNCMIAPQQNCGR